MTKYGKIKHKIETDRIDQDATFKVCFKHIKKLIN